MYQGFCKGVWVFIEFFDDYSRVLQGCFMGVSSVFQRYFEAGLRVF